MAVDRVRLRQALTDTVDAHGPGLFGLVVDGGEVVFQESVGVADLADRRPIDPADRFRIGSITKTYVTVLVLQLVADGVLALADPVERWLPGVVPGGDRITVELLLRMRSGLPDYTEAIFGNPPDPTVLGHYWSPERVLAAGLGWPDRIAEDTAFRYCNTDYVLLGLIVERATGERVDAQLWQRIVRPLGLDGTTFPTVDEQLRGPHANGHLRVAPGAPYAEFTVMSPSEAWTAGAMIATPGDVAAFFDALFGGKLLDAAGLALMTDATEPLDGWRSRGIGLVRYDFGGTVAYGHHGGVPGFTSLALRSDTGRCVVLYQNGLDAHDVLTSDTPFIAAAFTG